MAVQEQKIFIICPRCDGKKEVYPEDFIPTHENPSPSSKVTCPMCEGEGYIEFGYFDTGDLINKINDCLDKLDDIKDKLDTFKQQAQNKLNNMDAKLDDIWEKLNE